MPREVPRIQQSPIWQAEHQSMIPIRLAEQQILLCLSGFVRLQLDDDILRDRNGATRGEGFRLLEDQHGAPVTLGRLMVSHAHKRLPYV